jgi:hypothetical protein
VNRSLALFGHRGIFSDPRFFDTDDNGDNANDGGEKSGDAITFKSQEDLDRLVQKRLDRQKDNLKKDKDFVGEIRAAIEGERTAEELKEQGKFEDMYNAEVTKNANLQKKIDELQDQIVERDRSDLRKTIAAKYKLPDELADRLKGETEEEITADAKDLAKKLNLGKSEEENESEKPPANRRKPIETDAGKGIRPQRPSGEKAGEGAEEGKAKTGYAFVREGDVSWGSA